MYQRPTKLRFIMHADDKTIYCNLENFTHLNMEMEINNRIKNNYMDER